MFAARRCYAEIARYGQTVEIAESQIRNIGNVSAHIRLSFHTANIRDRNGQSRTGKDKYKLTARSDLNSSSASAVLINREVSDIHLQASSTMRTVFFLLATMAGLALSATTETGAMANSADTDLAGTSDYTDLGDLAGLADDMDTVEAPDAAARWCSRRCRVGIHSMHYETS